MNAEFQHRFDLLFNGFSDSNKIDSTGALLEQIGSVRWFITLFKPSAVSRSLFVHAETYKNKDSMERTQVLDMLNDPSFKSIGFTLTKTAPHSTISRSDDDWALSMGEQLLAAFKQK